MRTEPLIDAIASDSHNIPASANAAGYITGYGIAWTAKDWARIRGARVKILQEWTENRALWREADVLDIENGALTIDQARTIASWRATEHLPTTLYSSASTATGVWTTIGHIPGVSQWIANWNLTEPEAAALLSSRVVAIQYASPNSGANTPLRIPGTRTPIKHANVDLSIASADWLDRFRTGAPGARAPAHRKVARVRKPHPKTAAGTLGAAILAAASTFARTKGVHLDGAEITIITAAGAFIAATVTPTRSRS